MEWNIEFYRENGLFCAWIDDQQGGSGIKVKADTKKQLAKEIGLYIQDMNDELDDWEN